ncbi:MAG TPA: TolC family protein [Blastocatellia bacterium]|nr:TolC family protein [Blastocatellia bacterium]
MSTRLPSAVSRLVVRSLSLLLLTASAAGQEPAIGVVHNNDRAPLTLRAPNPSTTDSAVTAAASVLSRYSDPLQGASSSDLVRRALGANAELAAARLEIERARARLRQAGLRPNPSVDFEQMTGSWTGSSGDQETSIAFTLPLELGGKRQRRIDLARAELEAVEAEVADRERRLAADVRIAYVEALAALRELETTEQLNNVDVQTAQIVKARVDEGESAPLELNLLRVEVDRLRSRRALVEGRLQAALLKLRSLAAISIDEPLRLREDLIAPLLPVAPASLEAAIDTALRTRPDLRLARLTENVAQAGWRLARAQATPDIAPFTRYTRSNSVFDNTPVGVLRDKDNLLSFGVSVSIPVFNRNQGAKDEAAAAIAQARHRREFLEAVVRSEVAAALARYEAARTALAAFEQGVIARSTQNINSIRGAYEVGAFRVTDLLTEQRRLVDSQREFIEALAERYRAMADLLCAMGEAPDKRGN